MNPADICGALGGNPDWAANWTLGGVEFYGEIMDSATFGVWLTTEPIAPDEYAALDVPEGFRKSGCGRSQHDGAFFRRPPGADRDGPVETIRVDGRTFALVARPGAPEPGFDGVTVLPVFKSHRVLFCAGRTIEIIDTNDDFPGGTSLVPQVTETHLKQRRTEQTARQMPSGWTSRFVTLSENLVIDLPSPARVAIFRNGEIFHGPTTV